MENCWIWGCTETASITEPFLVKNSYKAAIPAVSIEIHFCHRHQHVFQYDPDDPDLSAELTCIDKSCIKDCHHEAIDENEPAVEWNPDKYVYFMIQRETDSHPVPMLFGDYFDASCMNELREIEREEMSQLVQLQEKRKRLVENDDSDCPVYNKSKTQLRRVEEMNAQNVLKVDKADIDTMRNFIQGKKDHRINDFDVDITKLQAKATARQQFF